MLDKDLVNRLERNMTLCENRLLLNKDPYLTYISLLQLNELYRQVTGNYYFDGDAFEDEHPQLLKKISKINNNVTKIEKKNYLDFNCYCKDKLPHILNSAIKLVESCSFKTFSSFDDINKSDIGPLINNYLEYINFSNKELYNYLCKNKYIINVDNVSSDHVGAIFFDSTGEEDYICVGNKDRCNLEIAATTMHEMGHKDDVLGLDINNKNRYVFFSPYIEVPSHMIQNKFYDYLIDENINKDFARMAKYGMLENSIYNLSFCFSYFNNGDTKSDLDIINYVKYGFGQFVGGIVNLNDSFSFHMFDKNHHNVFDSSLLNKLNIDDDKCKKVFCKELNKIYK